MSVGGGSHYPKHVDNVLGAPEDTRKLTAIYYMNRGWDEDNGGHIRLFDSERAVGMYMYQSSTRTSDS